MTKEFIYVKALTEHVSLVKHKKTGRTGRVIWTSMAGNTNFFTVHYLNGGEGKKYEGMCRPENFYLIIPTVKETVPRCSA